jgi:hypothetical protein
MTKGLQSHDYRTKIREKSMKSDKRTKGKGKQTLEEANERRSHTNQRVPNLNGIGEA